MIFNCYLWLWTVLPSLLTFDLQSFTSFIWNLTCAHPLTFDADLWHLAFDYSFFFLAMFSNLWPLIFSLWQLTFDFRPRIDEPLFSILNLNVSHLAFELWTLIKVPSPLTFHPWTLISASFPLFSEFRNIIFDFWTFNHDPSSNIPNFGFSYLTSILWTLIANPSPSTLYTWPLSPHICPLFSEFWHLNFDLWTFIHDPTS